MTVMNMAMKALRSIAAGALLATLPLAAPAQAQDNEIDAAVSLVRSFVAEHERRMEAGEQPLLNVAAASRPYLIDGLAHEGLQGTLQFDPVYGAQDVDIAGLTVAPDPQDPILRGAAQIIVSFTNFGAPRTMHYTLVKAGNGAWQISDIYSQDDGWSLADLVQDAGLDVRSDPQSEVTFSAAGDAGAEAETVPGMEEGDLPGNGLAENGTDLLFVLDASGSMWGQIDGVAKIVTARQALAGLMGDLAANTNVGLMAYGHRREGDCSDTEILYPVANYEAGRLTPAINGIVPRGKTPIAGALQLAAEAMPQSERPANVLLISDGLETCGGDPCAAARALAERGIGTRVHVVGFDLSEEENAALQCIAENGGGNYYAANDAKAFADAIHQAVADAKAPAVAPAPEPQPVSAPQTVFEENFDGEELDPKWQRVNPTPNLTAFDGEGGLFVSALGGETVYDNPNARNRLLLDHALPEGDFDLALNFRLFRQSGVEFAWVAVQEDASNQIGALAWTWTKGCGTYLNLSLIKLSGKADAKPEVAQFEEKLFSGPILKDLCSKGPRAYGDAVLEALGTDGAELRLKRRGRKITAAISMRLPAHGDREAEDFSFETEPMTVLRLSGKPGVLVGQWKQAKLGESHFLLDRFAIEAAP